MIEFPCPECDALMSVPDSLAGQSQMCPECGAPAIVPGQDVPVLQVVEDTWVPPEDGAAMAVGLLPDARGPDVKRWLPLAVLWLVPVLYAVLAVSTLFMGSNHERLAAGVPYAVNAVILLAGTWLCQKRKVRMAAVYAVCAVLQYGIASYSVADTKQLGHPSEDLFAGFLLAVVFGILSLACGIRPLGALAAKLGARMRGPLARALRLVLIVVAFLLIAAGLVIYAIEKPEPKPLGPGVVYRRAETEEFVNETIEEAKDWAEIILNPVGWSAWLAQGPATDTVRSWRRRMERGHYDDGISVTLLAGRATGILLLLAFALFLLMVTPPSRPDQSNPTPPELERDD